jgi:hypothetical protein
LSRAIWSQSEVDQEANSFTLEEDGFAVVRAFAAPAEIARVTSEYDALVERWRTGETSSAGATCPALVWMKPSDSDDRGLVMPTLRKRAEAIAAGALGVDGRAVSVTSRIFLKPHGARATAPHQDDAYTPHLDARRVNLWISLTGADRNGGCLYYYAGSHREGSLPHVVDHSDPSSNTLKVEEPLRGRIVAPELSAGDALLHGPFVVHGAYPNRGRAPRKGVVLVCEPSGAT